MIFSGDQYSSADGLKSALERFIASNRVDATSHDLTRLYATSTTTGAIADFRANMVKIVPMRVMIGGKIADSGHVLYDIFKRGVGYSKMMQRTELALFFWGRNLLWKDRNAFNVPRRLTWINPNLYSIDAGYADGLRGFRLSRTSRYEEPLPDDPDIPRQDAVYMHEVDFDDDFDGVSPAERAFLEGSTEPEKAQMLLSTFRNMGIPMGIVQPAENSKEMSDPERNVLIDVLRRVATGTINAGRTIVSKRRYDWRQMQSLIKDMDLSPIAKEVRESICIGSGVPLGLVQSGSSNYAEFEGLRRTWAESWLVPRVEWHAQELTEQLAGDPFLQYWLGEEIVIEPDLDAVPFLKEITATRLNVITTKAQSGIISMYDAQVQAGETPNEAFRDIYIVPGFGAPVPADQVPHLYKALLPQLGVPGGAAPALPTIPDQPQMLPDPPTPDPTSPDPVQASGAASAEKSDDDTAFFVGIDLGSQPDLIGLQRQIARLYQDAAVNWNPPDDFHITIAYAPDAPNAEQVQVALAAVQAIPLPNIRGRIGSLRQFEGVGQHALHFLIRQNADLRAYQRAVYDTCRAAGLQLSQYSEPERWIPHITMGYSPVRLTTYTWNSKLVVPCDRVIVTHGEQQLWHSAVEDTHEAEVSDAAKTFIPDGQWKELKDWQALVSRKGASYPFKAAALPRPIALFVRFMLDEGDDPAAVFDDARYFLPLTQGMKGYETTRAAFVKEMIRIIGEGQRSEVSRAKFGGQMRAALRRFGLLAFADGRESEGNTAESMSKKELATFRAWQEETSGYISGLGAEMFKEGGISEAQVELRANMWADKSLRDIYFRGKALAAPKKLKRWRRDPAKDSCSDCLARDGMVKTMEEWEAIGLPGDSRLECHGFSCGCELEDVE